MSLSFLFWHRMQAKRCGPAAAVRARARALVASSCTLTEEASRAAKEQSSCPGGATLIGRGAFGCVYSTVTATGARYAVKCVDSSKFREIELDVMHRLEHPNLVACIDSLRRGEFVYMAMEHALCSMDILLREGQRLALAVVARAVLDAVAFLHEHGVAHCDVKPANLLVFAGHGPNGACVRLADFGCAVRLNEPWRRILGTCAYSAPEVLEFVDGDGRDLSATTRLPLPAAADSWSVGVTLLEVASLKLPFGEEGARVRNALYQTFLDAERTGKFWPSSAGAGEAQLVWFRSTIMSMLRSDPRMRNSVRACAEEVRAAMELSTIIVN